MTYQHNVTIKQESASPAASDFSSPDAGNCHLLNDSSTHGRPSGNRRASLSVKRVKSEVEGPAPNPETKSKLKSTVLGRRKARGVIEEYSDLFEKPKPNKLTPADLEKRAKRKKQNREAAKRCREKKKQNQNMTAQEHDDIVKENARLQRSICLYRKSFTSMRNCLAEHLVCGDCRLSAASRKEHFDQLLETSRPLLSGITYNCQSDQRFTATTLTTDSCDQRFTATTLTTDSCDLDNRGQNYHSTSIDSSRDTPISLSSSDTTDYAPSDAGDSKDSPSLQSWDLQNINPDIPVDQVYPNMIEEIINQPNLKQIVDELHHVTRESREMGDFGLIRSAIDNGSDFCSPLREDCVGENHHIPRAALAYRSGDSLTAYAWNSTDRADQLYQCVSPNLVQPNSTMFHAAPYPVPAPGQVTKVDGYDQDMTNWMDQNIDHADLNNNKATASTPALSTPGSKKLFCVEQHFRKSFHETHPSPAQNGDHLDHFPQRCHFLSPISPDSYRH